MPKIYMSEILVYNKYTDNNSPLLSKMTLYKLIAKNLVWPFGLAWIIVTLKELDSKIDIVVFIAYNLHCN